MGEKQVIRRENWRGEERRGEGRMMNEFRAGQVS